MLDVDHQLQQGRYRIKQSLGRGGMGTVYLATDRNLAERLVAIKENGDSTPEIQQQFQHEASVLARLTHPNLPRVTDYFIESSGFQYLVMDYVIGEDLRQIVQKQEGPLPEASVLTWISKVMDALEYMHGWVNPETGIASPIVHRDIKPGNIKVAPNDRVVLVDFGLAKYLSSEVTQIGARGATPGYSPPEQYTGGTDPRSDIYALGATMYMLLTGQRPADAIQLATGETLTPPREIYSRITPNTERVILRAMQKRPSERYQTVQQMRVALFSGEVEDSEKTVLPAAGRVQGTQEVLPSKPFVPRPGLWSGLLLLAILAIVALLSDVPGQLNRGWQAIRGSDSPTATAAVSTPIESTNGVAPSPTPSTTPTSTATSSDAAAALTTATPTLSITLSAEGVITDVLLVATLPATPTATATLTVTPSLEIAAVPTDTLPIEPAATNTVIATATAPPAATSTATPLPTPTFTPQPTATNTVAPTATSTATATVPPTVTSTTTPLPTNTFTPQPTATDTVAPTATATATATAPPTATSTETPRPTPTFTPQPTATNTATPTAAATATATSTATPLPTHTFTAQPTATTATSTTTPSPTDTFTPQPTATSTAEPTATATATAIAPPTATSTTTPSPTDTLTPQPTATSTVEPTATATATAIAPPTATSTTTPSPTDTLTPQPTATSTVEPTSTATATATVPPTATSTTTPLPTPTFTPQPTATNTVAPTATATATATVPPTATKTRTPAPTDTFTAQPTATDTTTALPTATLVPLPTHTFTPRPTATSTATHSPTSTRTATPRPTATHTFTRTPTASASPTRTATPRPTATQTPRATPTPRAGEAHIHALDGATYHYVPAGEFTMGSDDRNDNATPVHTVYLDAFWMMETEVTNGKYLRCVNAGKCTDLPGNRYLHDAQYAEYPVVSITWEQAAAYAAAVGGRLPSEAEWEKAARGSSATDYPWGNQIPNQTLANFATGEAEPVGSYPAGASPYAMLDMAGNVKEWVADWYSPIYYSNSPDRNPLGPDTGLERGLRGGFFRNNAVMLRAARRDKGLPGGAFETIGFRVVIDEMQ